MFVMNVYEYNIIIRVIKVLHNAWGVVVMVQRY